MRSDPLFPSAGSKKFSDLGGVCPRKAFFFFFLCPVQTRLSPARMYESRFKNKEGNSAENQCGRLPS